MASYIVTDRIRVNIVHSFAVPPRVKCEQYDGNYTKLIQAIIYNGDVLYSIPSVVRRIVVSGLKPDNTGFSYDCTWSGNTVSFSLMRQMTVVDGKVPCNITMFDSENNQVSSAVFVLDVEKAALPSDVVVSSNDFQTFIDYVQAANLYSQYSKSYAVGNTGVRENENTDNAMHYSNIAEYYAHLARMFKGSPLTASTISEMEDVERVYVYTGNESGYNNGHWYFYDNNAWVDGGVYNSEGIQTDTELIAEGVAADAKTVGDILGHETLTTTAQTLRGAVNELNDKTKEMDLSNISAENGKFVFGNFSNSIYANETCTDGTYFYQVQSDYLGTNSAKVVKMDDGGNEISSVALGNAHYGLIIYDKKDNCLFVLRTATSLFKIPVDLSAVEIINITENLSSIGYYNNKCYGITTSHVFEFSDQFWTIEHTYTYTMPQNMPSDIQSMKVYDSLLFVACNYPNTILILDYKENKIIKYINIGDNVDGVSIGEIEGIEIIEENGYVNIYMSATRTIYSGHYYNKVFMINGNFSKHILKTYGINENLIAYYIVNGESVAKYSLGTSDYPFKSLLECLEHCHYDSVGKYQIAVTHINSTIDNPSSEYLTEPLDANVTFTSDSVPNSNFKWHNCKLNFYYRRNAASSCEIRFVLSDVTLFTSSSDAATKLTINNVQSKILVIGDLYQDYNMSGSTEVNGKLTRAGGGGGISYAQGLDTLAPNANRLNIAGNGLIYQRSITFNGKGTFRIKGNQLMQGILSFSNIDGAPNSRMFAISGYGAGGSARTFVGVLPPYNDNGAYTPTVDSGANAIDFVVTATGNTRATFTALGFVPTAQNNSIETELSFTATP